MDMMLITPEQAKLWLSATKRNRILDKNEVRTIAEDIRRGAWEGENGETIKIGINGEVIDGSHRLTAVIEANMPIKAYVVFNVKPSTKIDIGRHRTLTQNMYMAELAEKGDALLNCVIVSFIKTAILLEDGFTASICNQAKRKQSVDEIYNYYVNHREPIDTIRNITKQSQIQKGTRCTLVLYGMYAALNAGVDAEVIAEWYHVLNSGIYDEVKLRSTAAAKSILLFRNSCANILKLTSVTANENLGILKKVMSSIYHYNANEAIEKNYGSLYYPFVGTTLV